jgi:nucleoside 2-deoxyribosyltransferase
MKIYFAAALSNATEEFRQEISKTKDILRAHHEILDFFGYQPGADPKLIYKQDSDCVRNSDLLLAECSYPSTGVGIEIGLAIALEKPIVVAAKENAIVSGMILGNDYSKLKIIRYKDAEDLATKLKLCLTNAI